MVLGGDVCQLVDVPLADCLLERCRCGELESWKCVWDSLVYPKVVPGRHPASVHRVAVLFAFWYMLVCLSDVHRSAFPQFVHCALFSSSSFFIRVFLWDLFLPLAY